MSEETKGQTSGSADGTGNSAPEPPKEENTVTDATNQSKTAEDRSNTESKTKDQPPKSPVKEKDAKAGDGKGTNQKKGKRTEISRPKVREQPVPINGRPLETRWTLYYHKKGPKAQQKEDKDKEKDGTKEKEESESYRKSLEKLGSFNTIEGFYMLYVSVNRPESLPPNAEYFLFREDKLPVWEDYPEGGCWHIDVKEKTNLMWEKLVLATIGEVFAEPDVVGIAISLKPKGHILSVWNDAVMNTSKNLRFAIGEKLKSILDLSPSVTLKYKLHSQSILDGSSYINSATYVVE